MLSLLGLLPSRNTISPSVNRTPVSAWRLTVGPPWTHVSFDEEEEEEEEPRCNLCCAVM